MDHVVDHLTVLEDAVPDRDPVHLVDRQHRAELGHRRLEAATELHVAVGQLGSVGTRSTKGNNAPPVLAFGGRTDLDRGLLGALGQQASLEDEARVRLHKEGRAGADDDVGADVLNA